MSESKDVSTPIQNSDTVFLSNEIREIISYKPVWIVRHGILLFFIIFCFLVSLTFFIGYPSMFTANVEIIPSKRMQYSADVYILKNNLGNMRKGQKAIIKLDAFPFQQFGVLTGKIDSITSMSVDDSGYIVKVVFQEGLKTSFNKKIPYYSGLAGTIEIIVANTKLSDKLFIQFKNLFD